MPLGPALGGLGVALAGLAPTYPLTFAAVVLSGIGVAAFHPEGSRFANYVSGAKRASGMSLFSVGGNVGFALGPVLVTPLVVLFGLHGTVFVLVPTWLMAAGPDPRAAAPEALPPRRRRRARAARRRPRGLGAVRAARRRDRASLVRVLRAGHVHPALLRRRCTRARRAGNAALSAMLLGGAAGTLIGGPLADRFGRRTVLIGSMSLLPPLIVGFLSSGPVLACRSRRSRRGDDRHVRGDDRDGTGVPARSARHGRRGDDRACRSGSAGGRAAARRARRRPWPHGGVREDLAVLPLAALGLTLALPTRAPSASPPAPAPARFRSAESASNPGPLRRKRRELRASEQAAELSGSRRKAG